MSPERTIDTPYGVGRLVTDRARQPVVNLLLSHGAGNGIDAPDLAALARHLPRHGVTVHRFEQPWRVAGRKVAGPPPTLDAGLVAAADQLRPRTPLVIGGRSAGARSATRCARRLGASGCLALAFPLHPPGKPGKAGKSGSQGRSRVEELRGAGVPTLVVQGERDPMGRPEEFPPGTDMAVVPGADHGFKVPARGELTAEEALGVVVEAVLEWIVREAVGNR